MAEVQPAAEPLHVLLTRLRSERGFSIAQLAARTGLSPNAVRWIERGVTQPRPESLRSLGNALEVPYELLLQKAGYLEQQPGRSEDQEFLTLYRSLAPEHQDLVLQLMRALTGPAGQPPSTSG